MYTLDLRTGIVTRDSDGMVVAPVSDTTDLGHQEWLDWCAEGNSPMEVRSPEPIVEPRILTRLGFRRRFTMTERIAFDNAPDNQLLPAEARAAVRTMQNDLALAEEVDLDDPDVIAGVQMLVQIGLISQARATEVLG